MNRLIFKIIYRINWKLIVHTEFLKKRLCEEFRIDCNKIKVIKHGVYEVEEKILLSNAEAKNRLGLLADEILILFFGYITQYKGLDLLLAAFSELNTDRGIKLIIAGRPYENYRQKLIGLQNTYTSENIRFIIRRIDEDELPVIFGAADITVIPYREASQSGVLFMSYAYGVPVIGPDIGGFPYDIINNETGYIFKTGDVDDLKSQLVKFVNEGQENLLDRDRLRQFAHDNYSWQKSGIELINFISKE